MLHRLLLIIVMMCWTILATAHQRPATRHISSSDGLTNDFVTCMAIDGLGYIWVGTEAGISRIAGTTCESLLLTPQVDGQRITALCWHATTEQMLIGTERGLTTYCPATGITRQLTVAEGLAASSINDIVTKSDDVWLIYGNGQVQSLNCNSFMVTELKLPRLQTNRCAMDDGMGHLYIGHSHDGMSIVNLQNGSVVRHTHRPTVGNLPFGSAASLAEESPTTLPGNNVRRIYQDRQQRIWVGTDNGLALYNPQSQSFTKVSNGYDDNVYDILQINDTTLWVATDIGGILSLDPTLGSFDRLTNVGTSSLNTRHILQDEFGNVWVGCHSTGVDFFSAQPTGFAQLDYADDNGLSRPVYALCPDPEGGFWIASDDELSYWNDGKLCMRWSGHDVTRRKFFFTRCLLADHQGYVWMGIDDQGVYRFHKRTARMEHIPLLPERSDIHTFAEDTDGSVWIGGEYGIYRYQQGKVTRWSGRPSPESLKAPATAIIPLGENRLFVATLGDGIYVFDTLANKAKHLSTRGGLPSGKVNQVVSDWSGGLWMATDGGLVHLKYPANLTGMSIYGTPQGLPDSHVLALQHDGQGCIWLSTYAGISCFVKNTGKIYNYNHLDTRQGSNFAGSTAITDETGTVFFGSPSGVCYVRPLQAQQQVQLSDVQIVCCEAYNPVGQQTEVQRLTPDKDGYVQTTYRQNTLRLTFTMRNYAQTESAEFSYMMKGMDSKWYYIGNDHDVVFRGLRPGSYTFILRARLHSQDWIDAKVTQLHIRIAPPFWRSWWAYILYVLLLSAWALWLMHSYKRKLALRSKLELEKRESEQKQELWQERLRFFTNITHELRTPLTLILGPLDDLIDDPQLPESSRRRVGMIRKNADRLKSLIGEILEFRKTETQNRRLTVARGDVGQLVRETCLNYKELYHNPKVQFAYHIVDDLPPLFFDSEVVTTILNNFLSNAIKYTEQGSITTTVELGKPAGDETPATVNITVEDTGYGIAKDALPHIFERYYQAKGPHQASGTGIGLALVKALADLHQAQVSVVSHEGKGSRFTLSLPLSNTYPEALHKEDDVNGRQQAAQGMDAEEELAEGNAANQQPTLLIVEDNADIRQYIADSFADDFLILQAENGEEGLNVALQYIPDIIVSDIMMPKLNGIELTRQLKNDIRTSHVPIVLLTAKVTDEDKQQGYDSGADSYLTKPFTAKLLASRVNNLLTARRRLAEAIVNRTTATTPTIKTTVADQPTAGETAGGDFLSRLDREFLDKLNTVINDNITTADLDLPFVTDKMAMSHSTFYRKVKALTGLTAKEYIRKRRLQRCYELLQSGDYNVTEAAAMTGFNQLSHFRETFKKEFGELPSEVRRA